MQNTNLFYQKNALVTIMIARDIVNKEPGDKMVPIDLLYHALQFR